MHSADDREDIMAPTSASSESTVRETGQWSSRLFDIYRIPGGLLSAPNVDITQLQII